MTSFSAGHGRSHVVDSPPIYGIGRKRHFRTASWTAQFSNIFNSFHVLSAESEAFENAMLPFAALSMVRSNHVSKDVALIRFPLG